jgi:hypothetical protein
MQVVGVHDAAEEAAKNVKKWMQKEKVQSF